MNLVKNITGVMFLLISTTLFSQINDWSANIGGSENIFVTSIDLDNSGNIYSAGYFAGTADFDPGEGLVLLSAPSAVGFNKPTDIFIQKTDADGKLLWVKQLGGTSTNKAQSLAVDSQGNVYITGTFWDTVDFDPGPDSTFLTSTGFTDMFILKLDTDGNFIWAKNAGLIGNGLALDTLNNVYVTGWYEDTVDFDFSENVFNLVSNGSFEVFVLKLDTEGNFAWAKSMGGSGADFAHAIAVDQSGNVYTTGTFRGNVDFDPGEFVTSLTSVNGPGIKGPSEDIFVQKLDTDGNFIWAKSMGGSESDIGMTIAVNADQQVFVSGKFAGTSTFGSDGGSPVTLISSGSIIGSSEGTDAFIQKLNENGSLAWVKQIKGIGDSEGRSVKVDPDGSSYVVGTFKISSDFDPGTDTLEFVSGGEGGIPNGFYIKLAENGILQEAKHFKASQLANVNSLALDGSNNIYLTGDFTNSLSTNPCDEADLLNAEGSRINIFVQKWSACITTSSNLTQVSCDSQLSPSGKYLWKESGIYLDTIPNSLCCDSVITVDLTIIKVDNSISIDETSLSASSMEGATYQWKNCESNEVLDGETNHTFTALSSGSYAVEISQNGCVSTSECVEVEVSIPVLHTKNPENDISIYPNPVSSAGKFFIELGSVRAQIAIKLYKISGELIYETNTTPDQRIMMDIKGLPGIYILKVSTTDREFTMKLIKM